MNNVGKTRTLEHDSWSLRQISIGIDPTSISVSLWLIFLIWVTLGRDLRIEVYILTDTCEVANGVFLRKQCVLLYIPLHVVLYAADDH